jgi:hypothetical protein
MPALSLCDGITIDRWGTDRFTISSPNFHFPFIRYRV